MRSREGSNPLPVYYRQPYLAMADFKIQTHDLTKSHFPNMLTIA